jgi:signal transduction histidine kinase
MAGKPSLRTELLFHLTFLAAAALLVGVVTVLGATAVAPERTFPLLVTLVALEVGVFVVYGGYLLRRLVLRPLSDVMAAADAVAEGRLEARAPDAETRDFAVLAERVNRMTDRLLDAQSQLVRTEKLATVGRLAAGIAHEVGNPLGAAGTYLEVLRRRGADGEVTAGMARELDRIDRIVRSLLDYARPHDEPPALVDAAAVARNAFALLEAQGAFKGLRPALDVGADVPAILGRPHVLEQVVVNLLLNAADAAPGGAVVLAVHRWVFEPEHLPPVRRAVDPPGASWPRSPDRRPSRSEFQPGQMGVLFVVADSGTGIPPAERDRVFEPFYTTKDPGRGTGLGLAIVARGVDETGGVVWVDRAREGGASFKVFFPEAAMTSDPQTAIPSPQ